MTGRAARGAVAFLAFVQGPALWAMVALVLAQEAAGAMATWWVIAIARDIADGHLALRALGELAALQSLSYLAGAASWLYAERAGFGAYARYLQCFVRNNRRRTGLLGDTTAREATEPFLTGEAFQVSFSLVYDLQYDLRLLANVAFNAAVFGLAIDAALPLAYLAAFALLVALQWALRKPMTRAYLHNQTMTNRMTARTYNAWDNVATGNPHNLLLWQRDFRERWNLALSAQIRAIMLREGWSALSGVLALCIILAATALIVWQEQGNAALLIGLAATLPRQLEMTMDLHQLTTGMNELVAIWSRMQGAMAHVQPEQTVWPAGRIALADIRVGEDDAPLATCAALDDAFACIGRQPTGWVRIRGRNGSGKSSLLAELKARLGARAFYWPAHDRLRFRFNAQAPLPVAGLGDDAEISEDDAPEAEDFCAAEAAAETQGYSSGERQLQVLRELVEHTRCRYYLLDEWDANLDAANRDKAVALVRQLAARARVIEVSHALA